MTAGSASDPPPAASGDKARWRRWAESLPVLEDRATSAVSAAVDEFLADRLGPGAVVASSRPLPGEVPVTLPRCRAAGMVLALPRLTRVSDGDAVDAVSWHDGSPPLERHPFGFEQPPSGRPAIGADRLDALIVPGRCFDRRGFRLGRGGGHYDRLVPLLRAGVPVIGVTVAARVVDALPTEPHDRPMTHLATEAGVRPVNI